MYTARMVENRSFVQISGRLGAGDSLPERTAAPAVDAQSGNSPALLQAFTAHRHVGDVTADFSCRREISYLDTDVYGAVKYNKVQKAYSVLFTNPNRQLNHNSPVEGFWFPT